MYSVRRPSTGDPFCRPLSAQRYSEAIDAPRFLAARRAAAALVPSLETHAERVLRAIINKGLRCGAH